MQRIHKGKIDHASAVHDDHKVSIMCRNKFQVFQLHVVETVIALFVHAVIAFAGLTGQYIDRRLTSGGRCVLFRDRNARRMPERRHGAEYLVEILHPFDTFLLLLPIGFIGVGIEPVETVQPGGTGDFKACIQQALLNGHAEALTDSA